MGSFALLERAEEPWPGLESGSLAARAPRVEIRVVSLSWPCPQCTTRRVSPLHSTLSSTLPLGFQNG